MMTTTLLARTHLRTTDKILITHTRSNLSHNYLQT